MRICVIGAGFVGLTCALKLSEKGHKTTVFEKEKGPGGLASGFKDKKWSWLLEKHYHHLFTSDNAILHLAKEVNHTITFVRPKTSTFYKGQVHQLDSPLSLLTFPYLGLVDKLRTASVLLYLRLTPWWKPLEKIASRSFLETTMGTKSWEILWHPLFVKKFGKEAGKIPASWFWARIKKRSASLGYPKGGFQSLATSIEQSAKNLSAVFIYNTNVTIVERAGENVCITTGGSKKYTFDKVVCTLPTPLFTKITKGLPMSYVKKLQTLDGVGAINLVLSIKQPFFADNTYWLNVNDKDFPFLAVVEHTSLVDRKNYGGDTLLYVGNYLPATHPYFQKTDAELLSGFLPYLQKINPNFSTSWIRKSWVFKALFAQPIVPLNYSKKVPPLKTPIGGVYLANIQQVYPWDRGTNYAVELGEKVAKLVQSAK